MRFLLFASAVALSWAGFADVVGVKDPVAVDGRLDETVWSQVDWETGFQRFVNAKKGRTPIAQTAFAILTDGEALYVGIKANHPKMDELKALGSCAIWGAEAVELYFVPDGGEFEYYQFLIAFQGLKKAFFYSEGGNIQPDPFGPDWDMKVAETPTGWTAEARIPLSAFYMTRGGAWKDTWKVNVARTYREQGVFDCSCWIDGASYRDLKNFRTVKGFPQRRAEEDIWVKSVVSDVKGKEGERLVGSLDFVINVAKAGTYTLASGFSEPVKADLAIGDNKVTVNAIFPENGRHQLPVTLTCAEGKGVSKRTYPLIVDYQPLRLSFAVPSYRGNFYPGQNSDRVEGTVVSSVAGPVEVALEGPGFGKCNATLPEKGGVFAFDTKGFEVGTALLTVKAGGETLTRKVRKLAPLGEGQHVSWIENGNLVVDGKPLLRRNLYAEYYRGGEAFKEKYDADDLRVTKVARKGCGTLEPARLLGKGVEQKEATHDVKPCDELFRKIDAVIENAKKGSGVYYYISDEPECRGLSPIYLRHIYDYVCDKDPYHVILSCSRAGEKYIDCADWFETHPYINVHMKDGKRVYGRQFNELGDFVSAFNPEKHPDKCVGGTATCFAYSQGDYPTFTEYLANAWCEFLRGAKTLYPFAWYSMGERASLYEGTRFLFSSAEALQDILLFGRRQTLVKTPDYEAALWTMPDGEQMFCVQNFRTVPTEANVPGLAGTFVEFRGKRTFDFSKLKANSFKLKALESLIATTKKRDAGLPTFAETQAVVDAAEKERLSRPNQLLGRQQDFDVTASTKKAQERKVFDGVRDVLAWSYKTKNGFYELTFKKLVPTFSEISVYGHNLDGLRVKVAEGGDLKELVPVYKNADKFNVRYVFNRPYAATKVRLEFPKEKVELYEIELPAVTEKK